MYQEKNLPEKLRQVVERWTAAGLAFYLGPENMFVHFGRAIKYLDESGISKAPGSWYAKSGPDQVPAPLPTAQVEDLARALALTCRPTWSVHLGYQCNYTCTMCPYHGEPYRERFWAERPNRRRTVPEAEAIRIIDKLHAGRVEQLAIATAGEFFLYPHWEAVCRHATGLGMRVHVTTNGSLLDDAFCHRIYEVGIRDLNFSLDALSQEVYAAVRSANERYFRTATAAPVLAKSLGFNVTVNFTRQAENLHEVEPFVRHWMAQEVDSIAICYEVEWAEHCVKDVLGTAADEFIDGLCSNYGSFIVLADGSVAPCCGMLCLNDQDYQEGFPRLDFLTESMDHITECLNQAMADPSSPMKRICRNCALYNVAHRDERRLDGGWYLTEDRGSSTYQRSLGPLPSELENLMTERAEPRIRELARLGRPVGIYGAGAHTRTLYDMTSLASANIVALFDASPAKQGKEAFGHLVLPPERISGSGAEVILISSQVYQAEIYSQLKHLEGEGLELVKLY